MERDDTERAGKRCGGCPEFESTRLSLLEILERIW